MSKKIAVLVTDQFEDIEYTSPVKAYEEAGYSVVAIDLEAGKEVTGKHGEKVKIEKAISDVDASDFDALLIPGDSLQICFVQMTVRENSRKRLSKIKSLFSLFATARKY